MVRKSVVAFLCSALVMVSIAQSNSKKANPLLKNFHSYNSVQLLTGSSTTSFSLHTVNGFNKQRLFVGLGTGFDYYYKTSVPLFGEARFDLNTGERKLQLFANGGLHIPLGNTNTKEPGKTGDFKAGRLLAGGFDYYIPHKTDALVMGIAFAQKKLTQMVDNNVWNPVLNRIENIPLKQVYSFNRVWIKLGYVF